MEVECLIVVGSFWIIVVCEVCKSGGCWVEGKFGVGERGIVVFGCRDWEDEEGLWGSKFYFLKKSFLGF